MSALYDDPEAFFARRGRSTFLTLDAAVRVCELSSERGLVIYRVEGGIWRSPGFEARYDAIWDGQMPPLSTDAARSNNSRAIEMIQHDNAGCDTFVISAKSNQTAASE